VVKAIDGSIGVAVELPPLAQLWLARAALTLPLSPREEDQFFFRYSNGGQTALVA
jgi:hypothetical protein